MTRAERDELRRIIRERTKVLQADINARQAELIAELDQQLEAQYAAAVKRWEDAQTVISEALREANRKVNDVYRDYYGREKWGEKSDRALVYAHEPDAPTSQQGKERLIEVRAIEAKVANARTELARRQVQLCEELAIGALESADAKDFLNRIPTVTELVPASRLNEIAGA